MSPSHLTAQLSAHAAALRHGLPSKNMQLIGVYGRDGSGVTIAALAEILKTTGQRVGIIASEYVEVAGERASGSDQAQPFEDPFRLQALLADMRRAKCAYVLLELPVMLPAHQFAAIPLSLLLVRRIADAYLDQVTVAAAVTHLGGLVRKTSGIIVVPRDDPGFEDISKHAQPGLLMSYGTDDPAETKIEKVQLYPKGCMVELRVDHQTTLSLTSRLTGKQTIYSLTAAAAAAYMLHVPLPEIEKGIAKLPQPAAAFEYVITERPYQIVLDSSVSPNGIAEVAETLKHFAKNRLIAVVGASLNQPAAWRSVIGEVVASFADRVIITDGDYTAEEDAKTVRAQLIEGAARGGSEASLDEVADRHAAFEKALSIARRGDIILVCGSSARAYRQTGNERLAWSDKKIFEELL
ncbi:MAG TPA: cyanophycin synthetase [Candidatus Saccharimonadales bacterium]|nr:cyanophycin synthetase [Candidatus Saccharimonadales bacterium]